VLCYTLHWSRLHNFVHDILLRAKTVWWSHTVEVSTKNRLRMGWRLAARCKKVRTLRQSTPFQEPRSRCVRIARFIHHTGTASVTNVTKNKLFCTIRTDSIARCDQFEHFTSQHMPKELLTWTARLELQKCHNKRSVLDIKKSKWCSALTKKKKW
jgi:hypothetical protein